MPIRFGDLFLFGFIVLLVYWRFRKKRRAKVSLRAADVTKDEVAIATVVAEERAVCERKLVMDPPLRATVGTEPTGKKANVAGRGCLFECIEYRCGSELETHVHRIDGRGRQVSESQVYREPLRQVIESFTTVAA